MFHQGSSSEEDSCVLRLSLEYLIALDLEYLRRHAAPPLYRAGVVYGRTREWDSIAAVIARSYGDCKSLSAWRIAELRLSGVWAKPVFRWVQRKDDGGKDFHILVFLGSRYEDPSRILGMRADALYFVMPEHAA